MCVCQCSKEIYCKELGHMIIEEAYPEIYGLSGMPETNGGQLLGSISESLRPMGANCPVPAQRTAESRSRKSQCFS